MEGAGQQTRVPKNLGGVGGSDGPGHCGTIQLPGRSHMLSREEILNKTKTEQKETFFVSLTFHTKEEENIYVSEENIVGFYLSRCFFR